MSGYARFHRSLIGHPAFRNDAEAMAFAWMVLRASWKPVRVRYKGRAFTLNRGQLAVSQRDMADALDRDKAWVERLWKRLRAEAMIAVAYEAGAAVISICNYDKYQHSNDEREAPDEASREADARQTQGTEQVREEGKKEEGEEANASSSSPPELRPQHVVEFWNEMAARTGLPQVRDLSEKRRRALKLRISRYSIDEIAAAILAIERTPFLLGQTGGSWRADFDFLLRPDTILKILEGKYDGTRQQSAGFGRA